MNTFSVTIKNLIYKMLWKLQIKTFLPLQLIGYAITLCIGVIIILTTYNIYKDIQPLLKKETDVFGNIYKGPPQIMNEKSYRIKGFQPVGYYAIRPFWEDGHSDGIYSYEYLKKLCSTFDN